MKKIISLFMAMLILMTGFATAVNASPVNAFAGNNKNMEVNNLGDNKVIQTAQIRNTARVEELQELKIQAMNAYAGIKKQASVVRKEMQQKNEMLNKCKNTDSENCANLKTEARVASGDYLENLANMLIKHLEAVQIKVKLSEEINEEEQVKIINLIGEKIDRLKSVKDEITRLKNNENSDIASRQEIVKKLKNEVQDAKVFLRKISYHVEARKLKELIAQQEIASDKIEKTISEMENVNTETLEDLLSIMEDDLEEARKYIVLAMGDTEDNALAVVKEDMMRNYLNKARVEVKDSYITLHKMVMIIKQEREIIGSEISDGSTISNNGASEISDGSDSEISNNGASTLSDDSKLSSGNKNVLKLSIPIGGTGNAKVDMTPIESVSCVSLSGSSISALNCDVMDENRHVNFIIEEYETGYTGMNNVEVVVSDNAVEGTCFCELVSYDGETRELTINVVSKNTLDN